MITMRVRLTPWSTRTDTHAVQLFAHSQRRMPHSTTLHRPAGGSSARWAAASMSCSCTTICSTGMVWRAINGTLLFPAEPFVRRRRCRLLSGAAVVRCIGSTPGRNKTKQDKSGSRQSSKLRERSSREATPGSIFDEEWDAFIVYLYDNGFYAADPHITLENLTDDKGATKRAVLLLCRKAPHLLADLPSNTITSIAQCKPPARDRKTLNAHKRLAATFLSESSLGAGDGGDASFQDVIRLLLAASNRDAGDAAANDKVFLKHSAALITAINQLIRTR